MGKGFKMAAFVAAIGLIVAVASYFIPDSLPVSAQKGDLDRVKMLIEKGEDVNKSGNKGIGTPLIEAIETNHMPIVKYLVEEAGADIEAASNLGDTPLYVAAGYNKPEALNYLVEKGVKINTPGKYGMTPLMEAAARGHDQIVARLLELGADVNHKSDEGKTALDYAVHYKRDAIVEMLKNHSAK